MRELTQQIVKVLVYSSDEVGIQEIKRPHINTAEIQVPKTELPKWSTLKMRVEIVANREVAERVFG